MISRFDSTRRWLRLFGLLTIAPLSGCFGPFAPCADRARAAISLTVMDSRTLQRPPSEVTAAADNGEYGDTLTYPAGTGAPLLFNLAPSRSGTFDVSVNAAGYLPWTRSGVVVRRSGRCDTVETEQLSAQLQIQ